MDNYIIKDKIYVERKGDELISTPKKSRYFQDYQNDSTFNPDEREKLISEWVCSTFVKFNDIFVAILNLRIKGKRVVDNEKYIKFKEFNESSIGFIMDFGALNKDFDVQGYLYSTFPVGNYENSIDALFEHDERHKCSMCDAYTYTEYIEHIFCEEFGAPICFKCLK